MCLFVGFEIPAEVKVKVKVKIHRYLSDIKKSEKGWEKAHDYHQTLLFIGEANVEDLELIKVSLAEIEFPSFLPSN
jgi:2'-5' RNA ligase